VTLFFSQKTSGSQQSSNLSTSVILKFRALDWKSTLATYLSLAGEVATASFLLVGLVRRVLSLAVLVPLIDIVLLTHCGNGGGLQQVYHVQLCAIKSKIHG
jgi:uncharacterized membrane protein YphA (DoxX/SURF4 family)